MKGPLQQQNADKNLLGGQTTKKSEKGDKKKELQTQLNQIEQLISDINNKEINAKMDIIIPIIQSISRSINSQDNLPAIIHLQKLIMNILVRFQNKCDHKFVTQIINLLLTQITKNNFQHSLKGEEKIAMVKKFNSNFQNSFQQSTLAIAAFIIEKASLQNLQEVLILLYFMIETKSKIQDSTMLEVNWLLRKSIREYRQFDSQYSTVVKFLTKYFVNKIFSLNQINQLTLKTYANFLIIFLLSAGDKQTQIKQIQHHFKPFSLIECLYTINLEQSPSKFYMSEQRQDLFIKLCIHFIKYNEQMVKKMIKFIIQVGCTPVMVSNLWSFFNTDNGHLMSQKERIYRAGEIISFFKDEYKQNPKKCFFCKKGSWINKAIQKKSVSLLLLNVQIDHPLTKNSQKQSIMKIEFEKGVYNLLIYFSDRKNPGFKILMKKQGKATDETKDLQQINNYKHESILINIAIQFKAENRVHIYVETTKLFEINNAGGLGRVKSVLVGTKQQQSMGCVIRKLYSMNVMEDISLSHYTKQRLTNQKEGNSRNKKLNEDTKYIKINVLDEIEIPREKKVFEKLGFSTKSLTFANVEINTIKTYRQIMDQFKGKQRLLSYILNALEAINSNNVLEAYINFMKQQLSNFHLTESNYYEIIFIHGFSIFLGKQMDIINSISDIVLEINEQTLKKKRVSKSRILYQIEMKLNLFLSRRAEHQSHKLIRFFEEYLQKTIKQSMQEGYNVCKQISQTLNYSLWNCINGNILQNPENLQKKEQIKHALNYFRQTKGSNNNEDNNQDNLQEIRTNFVEQLITTQKDFKYFPGTVRRILNIIVQNCKNDTFVYSQFVSYLNLLLVILLGISLSGGHRFKINQLIIVLEQIYLIFIDLSPQFAKMKQLPEEDQRIICVLLSQVYNLLPSIGVLCKIETEEYGDFEEVFYKVYASIQQRQHNFKNNRAFSLISKFYNICFELGSFCLKGRKAGFLSYMDYALRFLNHYKEELQWSQKTDVLTYKDRIALTEIYASCWKFVVGNPKNRSLTKNYYLDQETKIELAEKLNELNFGIYCPYPPKQQTKQNNQNIIQQIIQLHLFQSIEQKLPTYILANIGPKDLQVILEEIKQNIDKNKKLQKQQRLKLYLEMIQIINEYQKSIILEFNSEQFKKISEFTKKVQLIFKWYEIYKRIKKINELYERALEQPYSNNQQIANQFQTLLKQPFQRVLERLGEEKLFEKIKIIIHNFVIDNKGEISNGLEVHQNKNLYVLKLLKKECQDVNSQMIYEKKKKIKKIENLKLGMRTGQYSNFFMTERYQIEKVKITEVENKNLNIISQKVAKKVLLNNRTYFLDMHTKLSEEKTNVLNAYYNMIERLSSEEKLLNWGESKKYDYYNYYILDDYLSEQNVKLMLKRDNVLVFSSMIFGQMPRLIQSKLQFQCRSIAYGISIANNLFDLNSNKFFEFVNEKVKNYEPKKITKEKTKEKITSVKLIAYLITKSKIYQGRIQIKGQFIEFFENNYIDLNVYKQFYANQSEKRTYQEIAVSKKTLKIQISNIKYSHPKKYLQKFYSLEVYASSLSYFFVFQNKEDRQKFLNSSKIENRTTSDNIQYVNQICQAWEKRWINNFQYLMAINNIAGRSLNDVSQYYVMPWTVKNFKGLMDQTFMKNKSNFRDLNKSIGSLNPKKLQVILNKYANSIVESDISQKPYMFGGFYSNSAIVCNYLLRVNPFSVHHYELQGKHFDLYDRLFTNMQNQFDSVYKNTMDNRELVPEFYSAPQFFRNRNRYNFAYNPRKDRIDLQMNMPEWVVTKSPEQFVLKMRKVLQSDSVSQKLCDWIDIIFGKKSQMENAAENHNLYVHYLYKAKEISQQKALGKEQKQQLQTETEIKAHMIKQFGQVPKNIFGNKLSPKMSSRQFKQSIAISEKIRLDLTEQANKTHDGSIIYDFYDCILAVCSKNILTLVNTTEQASKSRCQQIFEEEIIRVSLSNIKKTKFILIFIITVSGKLIIVSFKRNMKGTLFIGKREQFKIDKKLDLFPTHKFRNVKTVSNYVILAEQNIIRVLKITKEYDKQKTNPMLSELVQDEKTDERRYFYDLGSFYLHRTSIVYLEVYPCLQIVVSVDESGYVNTFSLVPELTIRGTFLLNNLKASETVTKVIIHSVGLLVILTNLKQLMVYNIYGDLIQRVRFQTGISDIQFWNSKSSSQILVSTKNGEVHQIDLFEMVRPGQDCLEGKIIRLPISQNVIKINEKQNNKMIMDRFGKYWSVYVICSAQQNYVYLSEKQFFKIYNTKKFLRCCNQNNSYKNS